MAGKDDESRDLQITAKLQKGAPRLQIDLDDSITEKIVEAAGKKGKISIALEDLDIDLTHNQSFGMMQASTGCYSNPGGPSC